MVNPAYFWIDVKTLHYACGFMSCSLAQSIRGDGFQIPLGMAYLYDHTGNSSRRVEDLGRLIAGNFIEQCRSSEVRVACSFELSKMTSCILIQYQLMVQNS